MVQVVKRLFVSSHLDRGHSLFVDAALVPDPEVDVLHTLLVVVQEVAVALIELTKLTARTLIGYLVFLYIVLPFRNSHKL